MSQNIGSIFNDKRQEVVHCTRIDDTGNPNLLLTIGKYDGEYQHVVLSNDLGMKLILLISTCFANTIKVDEKE